MYRAVQAFCSFLLIAVCAGCNGRQEEPRKAETKTRLQPVSPHGQPKRPSRVVVPPEVREAWKSVRIAFMDKKASRETAYSIEIGQDFPIPGSPVILRVENFLPDFTMEGTLLTSKSKEPNNPAVQIIVLENGQQIFKGWLFAKYPSMHAFQHPKYGFKLIGFQAAKTTRS